MKIPETSRLVRSLTAVVGGFALFTETLSAAPFLYSPGDLVLAFRQTGSASDYAVNIGKATNYNNLPGGTTFTVTNLSVTQLTNAFPSVNELKWSVAAANRPPLDTNYPIQTLWIARPRLNNNVQSVPWVRKSQFSQGNIGGQVDGVGYNAAQASSNLPGGTNNTATGVVIPVNNNFNISQVIGPFGNYAGNFQGNAENLTAADFADDPQNISRSDLYELLPGSGDLPGRYLGYFELKPAGTLTFTAASTAPPAPTITSIVRNGAISTIFFTTVSGPTYRLRTTDAAGAATPVSTWATGSTISGTGSVLSLTDTNTADIRFFAVDAQ
ncbi:MAG: hypothetical protein H7Y43_14570 [Akkermansiaceae bacterium]|nr:hypothetical protein [Verrucomicrobiales bacterium]